VDWNILLSLICPLMMLFCMKGMLFSGHNHGDANCKTEQSQISPQHLQLLQTKVEELTEQNQYLLKEIKSMKESQSDQE